LRILLGVAFGPLVLAGPALCAESADEEALKREAIWTYLDRCDEPRASGATLASAQWDRLVDGGMDPEKILEITALLTEDCPYLSFEKAVVGAPLDLDSNQTGDAGDDGVGTVAIREMPLFDGPVGLRGLTPRLRGTYAAGCFSGFVSVASMITAVVILSNAAAMEPSVSGGSAFDELSDSFARTMAGAPALPFFPLSLITGIIAIACIDKVETRRMKPGEMWQVAGQQPAGRIGLYMTPAGVTLRF